MNRSVGIVLALLVSSCSAASENDLVEQARNDEVFMVAKDDAAMTAAFAKAQASLDEFLTAWHAPPPGAELFAVKIGISDGDNTEYFWIGELGEGMTTYYGSVNNAPQLVGNVKEGQVVEFEREDIVDWVYARDGRMIGNFTACAMLKNESDEARKAFLSEFRLRCDD